MKKIEDMELEEIIDTFANIVSKEIKKVYNLPPSNEPLRQIIGVDVDLINGVYVMHCEFDLTTKQLYLYSEKKYDNLYEAFNYIINIIQFNRKPKIIIDEPYPYMLSKMIDKHYNYSGIKIVEVEVVDTKNIKSINKELSNKTLMLLRKNNVLIHKNVKELLDIITRKK